jgi:hypothetical protein
VDNCSDQYPEGHSSPLLVHSFHELDIHHSERPSLPMDMRNRQHQWVLPFQELGQPFRVLDILHEVLQDQQADIDN